MPARRSIAVTASSSARSRSIWRARVQRLSCLRETGGRLVKALQHDDRDLARGLLPVVVKARVDAGWLEIKPLILVALRHMCAGLELLLPHFDRHFGMLHEVVVPRRMRRSAALGRDDHVVIPIARVDERVLANLFRLGALRREDQHLSAFERARSGLAIGSKVLDQVSIEFLKACAHPGVIPTPGACSFHRYLVPAPTTSSVGASKPPLPSKVRSSCSISSQAAA